MAITTETFNADGSQKIFTPATHILSESHIRIDYTYEDPDGIIRDHPITSASWDIINNSVAFREAPISPHIVSISISTDGSGLETPPSDVAKLASFINELLEVNASLSAIKSVADNKVTLDSLYADKTSLDRILTSIDNIDEVVTDVVNIDIVADSITDVNNIAATIVPNIAEILLADDNAVVATTSALSALNSLTTIETYYDTAPKYLAVQNIAAMMYDVDGNLEKIQYINATDVDYEVLTYTEGTLTGIDHYIDSVLKGNSVLSYTNGALTSVVFTGV